MQDTIILRSVVPWFSPFALLACVALGAMARILARDAGAPGKPASAQRLREAGALLLSSATAAGLRGGAATTRPADEAGK